MWGVLTWVAHECLFHDDDLYFLAPIQRVDYDADDDEYDTLT